MDLLERVKTYHIVTFGCQMNKNDSEHIAGMLEFQGLKPGTEESADVLVYNTCAVREKAEIRVVNHLKRWQYLRTRKGKQVELYMAGCMPAYNKEKLQKQLPFLNGFIDVAEARQYPARRKASPEAWVSIMSGCNNFCSYCIVPYTRGREKSRAVETILNEIGTIDFSKHEIVFLLGQNVNSYTGTYQDRHITFPRLLELILQQYPLIPKLGFLTSHPKDMSDELIEVIARYPKMDREIHFPLQAGNDRILQLMNRGYTYAQYKSLVEKLRARAPRVRIATDLIAGFPSETEAEFQDTLKAVQELDFYRVISAGYSPRQGTAAAKMELLPQEVVDERLLRLNDLVNSLKPK